jgi:hypothetical protein
MATKKERLTAETILKTNGKRFAAVHEPTIYPSEVAALVRERMSGSSVSESARLLGVSDEYLIEVLEGRWRPNRQLRKKLGLRTVYAIMETSSVRKIW